MTTGMATHHPRSPSHDCIDGFEWYARQGSNLRPTDSKSVSDRGTAQRYPTTAEETRRPANGGSGRFEPHQRASPHISRTAVQPHRRATSQPLTVLSDGMRIVDEAMPREGAEKLAGADAGVTRREVPGQSAVKDQRD
jgi:hypothetical protein